ncbi:MAG: Na(+)/H(+) antiporter subunit B [Fervidobacterium sp.]
MTIIAEFFSNIFTSTTNATAFLVGVMMVIFSIFAVETKKIIDSLIALSAVSLLSVFIFIVLKSPDVAITEAAVGSGLASVVMIFALWKIEAGEKR